MVKMANERVMSNSAVAQSYDEKVELTGSVNTVHISMNKDERYGANPDCDYAGYWSKGGNELCTLYIAVECQELEDMCAFKVRIQLYEASQDGSLFEIVENKPARYIPRDQDYVDVNVKYSEMAEFYYPVIPEESGDLLIFVNKTAPIGKGGDAVLTMNI